MNEAEAITCCVVGAGPAGMMLALLLAREGVRVRVLEKHADFLRDFRGDTIHPSTLDLIDELGLREALDRVPHQVVTRVRADVGGRVVTIADLSALHRPNRSIYLMPQWDFLELLVREASASASFELTMNAEVIDLVMDRGRVVGVVYRSGDEVRRLRADLVVACDGRGSTIRALRGARPFELGAPMDVLWFHASRSTHDPDESFGIVRPGRMLVVIDRGSYWQCGYLIPKGGYQRVRSEGLAALRASLSEVAPFLGDGRLEALATWDDVKVLRVEVNHLARWFRPGLLLLGDAAHAMSPIGGVGINLAIQDAVAAARRIAAPLRRGRVRTLDLARVQLRRAPPALLTQVAQLFIQRRVIGRVLERRPLRPPSLLPRALALRPVRRAVARALGLGLWPEHWRSPARERARASAPADDGA